MGTSANGSPDGPGVITVTASRSYEVIVGENLLKDAGSYICRVVSPAAAVIVSDDNVAPLYGQAVAASLEKEGISALLWTFPHGEDSKNASTLFSLLEFMAEHGITRSDLIIALGGGGSTKLIRPGEGRNIRLMAPKYPLEYIENRDKTCGDKIKISDFYREFLSQEV